MVNRVFRGKGQEGGMDLEATEQAVRQMGQRVGGGLLETMLNGVRSTPRPDVVCKQGHRARFTGLRSKRLVTVVGTVKLERGYYHCSQCGEGVIPEDVELDVQGTSFSPGVRRMMARVGAKEAFDEARQDLEELSGVKVSTKALERTSEAIGADIEATGQRECELAMCEKLEWLKVEREINRMYIAIDGTGVPVVPRDTEGRRGKDLEGKAKTREAKLGCVFTQTGVDEEGRPVRDPESTTYVGAIETTEDFGRRIYTEAIRRGLREAKEVVVIGDGAPWIWNLAAKHFWGAIEIVDLYHALEHLANASKAAYGALNPKSKQWLCAHRDDLKRGNIDAVVRSLKRLRPSGSEETEVVRKTIEYFKKNRERMRYDVFRKLGIFVGSGVVEAGCKTVMGRRLKQSGMRWTVRGANSIIALRCCQMSRRWECYWEARSAA
jgi:Uncharacterised protein family (UPF0236)